MVVRIARFVGRQVDLVILKDDYQLEEVIKLVGPSRPVSFPVGDKTPNGNRVTVSVAGAYLEHLCLNIEGQVIPFLQARSLQRPKENAVSISLRLGSGTKFTVV